MMLPAAAVTRRSLLLAGAALGAGAAVPAWALQAVAGAAPSAATGGTLRPLLDAFFAEQLQLSPESATQLGLDKGAGAPLRARLSDASDAGRARQRALVADQLRRLRAVDRATLSPAEQVDYDVVLYQRETATRVQAFDFGGSAYGPTPYIISQQSGVYQATPDFLDTKHPVETAADADAYLSRLKAFAGQLDANTERFRHDTAAGVIPPDFILDKTLAQMAALRVPAGQARVVESITRRAAAKGLPARYATEAAAIYTDDVLPALDRQIAAVRAVRPRARPVPGIWPVPQGDAFYAMALAANTTTRLTPDEVHSFGQDQARMLEARIDALLKKQGMTQGTLGERMAAIYKLPGQVFPNTDEGKQALIAYGNTRLAAIRERLPRAFKRMPAYRFEVRRVPKETEAGAASAFAQGAALDGSRPGYVYFNLADSAEWPKFMVDTTIYHEGLPGHQFEGGLALSNTDLPLIRKTGGFSGYGEGWALYAEQVADELGMYEDDPLGEIGYLKMALFRANRCIVDTGLHHLKWSREQAIGRFVNGMGESPGFAEREVDRYCVNPGQACSYKLGHASFLKLRDEAQRTLGDRFDIKDFHEAVLANGRLPLEVLERTTRVWIGARARA